MRRGGAKEGLILRPLFPPFLPQYSSNSYGENMRLLYKVLFSVGAAIFLLLAIYFLIVLNTDPAPAVGNHPPHAVIEGPQQANHSETVLFSASGSFDDDGDDLTFFWELADGTHHTGEVFEHTFTNYHGDIEKDTHRIDLTVSDGEYNDTATLYVTVVLPKDQRPPEVGLDSNRIDDPIKGITYIVNIVTISEGDNDIKNISYSIISADTGRTLAGGNNTTVYEAYQAMKSPFSNSSVKYMSGDEEMEELDTFKINAKPIGATEGDHFYLRHIPTGIMMGHARLTA